MNLGLALLSLAALVAALTFYLRSRAGDERYRRLIEQLPRTSVATFDRELRCTQVLGAATGMERDEFVGKRPEQLYPGPNGERLQVLCEHALEGEPQAFEFHSPLSGRDFWMQVVPLRERGSVVGGMAVSQDVTDLRLAERGRKAEARRRRLILDSMNEAYVSSDGEGIVTDWNRAAELTFGYTTEEAIGRSLTDLIIPPSDHDDLRALLARPFGVESGEARHELRAERRALHRDGGEFTVELAATLVEADGVRTLHTLMHDISDRKLAERDLHQHASDVEALADAVGELARSTAAQDARLAICRAAARIANADAAVLFEPDASGTGLRTTAAEGMDLAGLLLPFTGRSGSVRAFTTHDLLFVADVQEMAAVAESVFSGTDVVSALWSPVQSSPDRAAIGVIAVGWRTRIDSLSERLERIMSVISAEAAVAIERAALLNRLERMARTDDLTGLTNRGAWDIELARELVRAGREKSPIAIAMLDLDRFKDYNDRFGHQAGDRMLKQASSAWRGVLRETDLLARYGGEEFAVALPGCDSVTAAQLVERLREVTPEGESCSAGLACWDGRESADDLLGRADAAMYEAKRSGRDRTILA